MITIVATTVLWVSATLVVYHHVIYPIVLRLVAARRAVLAPPRVPADDDLPTVTLVVPAHNEQAVIAAKLADLAALRYPAGKLTVVLALDGCTDGTRALVEASGLLGGRQDRFRLVEFSPNRGKVAVLNACIAAARTDIVGLSDTSAIIGPDDLRRAVAHFSRPGVGVVCPSYRLPHSGGEGERAYWRHQIRVKTDEGAVAAPMGAHGSFYLFRRAAWEPLPPDTINDDFVLPMSIVLKGYDAVYDPVIAAVELERTRTGQDFRRRMRIGAGNMQQLVRLASLGSLRRPALAFVFLSGKGLRPLIPFLVVLAVAATTVLAAAGSVAYAALLAAEGVGLVVAVALAIAGPSRPRVLAWIGYFSAGHAASALGALLFLTGRHGAVWRLSSAAKGTPGDTVERA